MCVLVCYLEIADIIEFTHATIVINLTNSDVGFGYFCNTS